MSVTEPNNTFNLDLPQQLNFVKFFNNLAEKSSTTIRFFNRTDFYTVHGEDAFIISSINGVTVKYMGEEPKLSYVTLSKSQFELVLRELLLVKQYRVEVFLKQSQGKGNDWKVEFKGSPGNLSQFEEILFENADNIVYSNTVMAIKIVKNKELAIGCVDVVESKFSICEIVDNECFTELEALIAQISPKECLIPDSETIEITSLKNLLERNGILVARIKKSEFNSNDIIEDLNRLLYFQKGQTRNALTFSETQLKEAMCSLQALIKFLNLTSDERNFNQFKFETFDISRFVRLDNAALHALNIFPQNSSNIDHSVLNPNLSKSTSVMGILNNCSTNQGKRLLSQWIKQPLRDYKLINERLDVVDCFIKDMELRTSLTKDCLTRLPDILLLVKKLSSKKATLQDCYKIYQTVSGIPQLINTLKNSNNKHVKVMLLDPIWEILCDLQKYLEMIEQVLDLNLVERGEFLVKHTFDDELKELYQEKQKYEEKMLKLLRRTKDDLGFEDGKVKLECTDQHGYFFRVLLREEHVLRGNKNYRIIDAVKSGVRFTNDKLTEINDNYCGLKESYEKQQKAVVEQILDIAGGYAETLRNLNMYVATVDVLVSFAVSSVSAKVPYVRPKLYEMGSGILKLKKIRHPCLEQQDHISFIPNSAEFDKKDKTLHIITGPNMCGKSTFIRSVGVCVLMAHIGSPVPCESAEISVVDCILARVGADDCQLKGLSTFMLEMIETSTIVKTATPNSLVIIDELGRGTSTYDGCGIASAIVEHLANEVKCFSLFATHFHEIINLANKLQNIKNCHVTAVTTNNTITPLYQVKEGPCDKSYGIHCAKMVGFPEDVLQWAREYQKELEHYEGTKFIGNYENSIKRTIIDDGDEIINKTIEELLLLPLDDLSDQQLNEKIINIKEELMKNDNLFIKGLLFE